MICIPTLNSPEKEEKKGWHRTVVITPAWIGLYAMAQQPVHRHRKPTAVSSSECSTVYHRRKARGSRVGIGIIPNSSSTGSRQDEPPSPSIYTPTKPATELDEMHTGLEIASLLTRPILRPHFIDLLL